MTHRRTFGLIALGCLVLFTYVMLHAERADGLSCGTAFGSPSERLAPAQWDRCVDERRSQLANGAVVASLTLAFGYAALRSPATGQGEPS